jgi:DNA-binding MurR/RpiR family transcriptional regulator
MSEICNDNFQSIVEAYDGKLTDADRALIAIILGDPGGVVFQSASELAARAEVHASTVVRLSRKLGFDGYPDLRRKLRSEANTHYGPDERIRRRLEHLDRGSMLVELVESEIAALSAVPEALSQAQIDQAAAIIRAAPTTYLFGRGSAGPLLAHLDRRLRRGGFRTVVTANLQRREVVERLISLSEGDAVVAFAFQSPASLPAGFSAVIKHARAVGAKSVLISDSLGPTLRPRPDLLLSVSHPDEGELVMRSAQMLICEAIVLTLAQKDSAHAVGRLEALERLRAEFRDDEV